MNKYESISLKNRCLIYLCRKFFNILFQISKFTKKYEI